MRILHLLNWNMDKIKENMFKIQYQGFDAVQINPVQPLKEYSDEWWMSYQPCGFHIGNRYGDKEQLVQLCEEAQKYNIKIFADIICNHIAGKNDGSLVPHENVDSILKNNPTFFKERKIIYNWNNRFEVINYCMGLPGLNVKNHQLQDIIINFLNDLIDCGVEGFRFDAAKNIGLPEEGCDFWPRVIYCLKKYGLFLYGEVIFENKELIDKYTQYIKALTNSFGSNPANLIAFIESHDSYYDFGYTKGMSSKEITRHYNNLIEQFPHTLYFARPFDDEWQSIEIKKNHEKQKIKTIAS